MADEQVYFHDWEGQGAADVLSSFSADPNALDGATVLYAEYTYEDYSGSALVVFERAGKLFEVNGGHCSCNGLEDQWEPEETTAEALLMRPHLPEPLRTKLSVRRSPDGGTDG